MKCFWLQCGVHSGRWSCYLSVVWLCLIVGWMVVWVCVVFAVARAALIQKGLVWRILSTEHAMLCLFLTSSYSGTRLLPIPRCCPIPCLHRNPILCLSLPFLCRSIISDISPTLLSVFHILCLLSTSVPTGNCVPGGLHRPLCRVCTWMLVACHLGHPFS